MEGVELSGSLSSEQGITFAFLTSQQLCLPAQKTIQVQACQYQASGRVLLSPPLPEDLKTDKIMRFHPSLYLGVVYGGKESLFLGGVRICK